MNERTMHDHQLHEIIDTSEVDKAAVRKVLFALGEWPSATAVALALADDCQDGDAVLVLNVAARRMLAAHGRPAEPERILAELHHVMEHSPDPEIDPMTIAQRWLAAQPDAQHAPPLPVVIALARAVLFRAYDPSFIDPEATADELRAAGEEARRAGLALVSLGESMRNKD